MSGEKNSVKLTAEHVETFRAHGKPHGDRGNMTDGAQKIVQTWKDAGHPALPPDPCAQRGACQLEKANARWGETWELFVVAGGGRGASSGARRLAEWAELAVQQAQDGIKSC